MEISVVDVHDEAVLRQVYDVETRAMRVDRDDQFHRTWREMSTDWRTVDPGEKQILLAGRENASGPVVAAAGIYLSTLDNLDKAWFELWVDPARQHRGLGREMLERVLAVVAGEGRTEVLTESKIAHDQVADHRYRRFAEAAGFRYANTEVVRHLELPIAGDRLDAWAAQAAEKHGDAYRIDTHIGDVPDDVVGSLCALLGLLAVDAPTGEADWEEEAMSPERFRQRVANLAEAGIRRYESIAVAADGTVAAQSTLLVPPEDGEGASTDVTQWGTFVHREHRGNRLGLAVKAANLRAVQDNHPTMRRVVTQNADTNDWMVAINDQIGFFPVEDSVEFIRSLED